MPWLSLRDPRVHVGIQFIPRAQGVPMQLLWGPSMCKVATGRLLGEGLVISENKDSLVAPPGYFK